MIERQLSEMWQTTLNIPKISIRANFFSLGVGSLAALRLITKMNRFYGIDLGLASLIHASTIESVAELVRTRFSPNTTISLVPIQPHGTLPPLFIVHGVGGNVVNFYGLSQRMGRDQPVYGIQSQALVSSQAALLRLEDMAAYYLKEVRQVQPEGPYHFLGYSFGGTVVLEMAHQLRAKGQEVALLGMLDSKSREYQRAWTKAKSFQGRINQRMDLFRNNTGHLDWSNRLAYFREKVLTRTIRFSCMAAAVCKIKKVPSFMKSAYDINYVAIQNYQLRPYPGRMTLFRATEQDDPQAPRALGWDAIFSSGVEDIPLPGDHERIFLEPGIEVLATRLRECLNKK
jgi:thioesterase domain-containing protein/acyl carrier protein